MSKIKRNNHRQTPFGLSSGRRKVKRRRKEKKGEDFNSKEVLFYQRNSKFTSSVEDTAAYDFKIFLKKYFKGLVYSPYSAVFILLFIFIGIQNVFPVFSQQAEQKVWQSQSDWQQWELNNLEITENGNLVMAKYVEELAQGVVNSPQIIVAPDPSKTSTTEIIVEPTPTSTPTTTEIIVEPTPTSTPTTTEIIVEPTPASTPTTTEIIVEPEPEPDSNFTITASLNNLEVEVLSEPNLNNPNYNLSGFAKLKFLPEPNTIQNWMGFKTRVRNTDLSNTIKVLFSDNDEFYVEDMDEIDPGKILYIKIIFTSSGETTPILKLLRLFYLNAEDQINGSNDDNIDNQKPLKKVELSDRKKLKAKNKNKNKKVAPNEIINARSRYSRRFFEDHDQGQNEEQAPMATMKEQIFTKPVNFQDDEGNWFLIENEFETLETEDFEPDLIPAVDEPLAANVNEQSASFSYATLQNEWQTFFPKYANQAHHIEHGNRVIEFTINNANSNSQAQVNENQIIYENVFDQVDFVYTVNNSSVKEDIVIKSETNLDGISYQMKIANVNFVKNENGNIDFYDNNTEELVWSIQKPFAEDFIGQRQSGELDIVQQSPNTYQVSLIFDYELIHDPRIVFPLTIDPTVTVYVPASGYIDGMILFDGGSTYTPDTSGIDNAMAGVYSTDEWRVFYDFDTTAIPDDVTITDVKLTIRVADVTGTATHNINKMSNKASGRTNQQIFEDAGNDDSGGDTVAYLSDITTFQSTGEKADIDLGATADSDLDGLLSSNYFSIGIEGAAGTATFRTQEGTWPAYLTVTWSGCGDWTINRDTTISTNLDCSGTITINNSATVTFTGTTIEAANLTVSSGAVLSVNAQGESGAWDDGSPLNGTNLSGASGAGYGGDGGDGDTGLSGGSYFGSPGNPTDLGEHGGAVPSLAGGSGGGLLTLTISGTLDNSGTISSNGGDGDINGDGGASGGGSGGTIKATVGTLAGDGVFQANGGAGGDYSTHDGGGGGGGRIYISHPASSSYSGTYTTTGGNGPDSATDGVDGTIGIYDSTNDDIEIEDGWQWETGEDVSYKDVTITGAENVNTYNNLTLALTGDLTVTGTTWNIASGVSPTTTADNITITSSTITNASNKSDDLTLTAASDITLASNSTITANLNVTAASMTINSGNTISAYQRGDSIGEGEGQGSDGNSISGGSGGGGYGGIGGDGDLGISGGITFGSESQPTDVGSAGGWTPGRSSFGGGKIKITTTGTLTVNGDITANGRNGSTDGGEFSAGGGSGGSIYLIAGTLAGTTGAITANGGPGGDGSPHDGGGGGGGRISTWECVDNYSGSKTSDGGNGPGDATNGANSTPYNNPGAPSLCFPTGTFNSVAQKTDGSGTVDISIEVDDPGNNDTKAQIEYDTDSNCDSWSGPNPR